MTCEQITGFYSYCGGLPAPESADNPLGYKFSWSSRGVLLALLNTARLYADGNVVEVSGKELMSQAKPYYINPAFAFVGYPNRDSTPFREYYAIPEAKNVVRGTLRYAGFPAFIKTLVDMGFLDAEPKDYLNEAKPWAEVTKQVLGASDANEETLIIKLRALTTWESEADMERILAGLRWIGIFSETEMIEPRGTILDTLCATLENKMRYEAGERDMVMLQHKFDVSYPNGRTETRTSTLLDYGAPTGSGGASSMAKLVGVPCGVAVQLVLDGVITERGVLAPYTRNLVDPLMAAIEAEGITMVERVL